MNKVLIIDDDKELCALMKKCIEQEKLSAVTVYNGIEGVRLIDENKDSYSLIILDVMLPDIDGFQILQKIRDKSNIPVLMLTAKSSEEDKVFGLRLGADDYLTKPFGINELLARVNSLIRRYTTLNPFTADIDSISLKDNIHVKQGQIYGLLGRNGAGKTTIMKMILGLTDITSGEVDVFGQNIKGREKRVYPRIGAIIETPGFYPNLTGTENLEIFAKLRGTAAPNAVKNALEIVGLPYRDKKLFSKYSLGMKQRLGIANAILHDPELLILDEPTNGLDPIGIAEVRDFIKTLSIERGKTILISSHILSEIALLADDIGIIDHGVLLEENSMNELQKKNSKYILLQVSDIPKTSLVLERQFGVTEYSVQDEHTLRIYDTSLDMAAVNKALVVQDIAVISSQLCNDTLEDYFKKITGGEGIA